MDKVTFIQENNEPVEFFVVEQTRVNGINYILVTDTEKEDGIALILRDDAKPEDTESLYHIVSEEVELNAVADIFANLLDDIEFEDDIEDDIEE